jgi:hypothetical protein
VETGGVTSTSGDGRGHVSAEPFSRLFHGFGFVMNLRRCEQRTDVVREPRLSRGDAVVAMAVQQPALLEQYFHDVLAGISLARSMTAPFYAS